MNWKKISAALVSCIMAGALLTGCGDDAVQKDEQKAEQKVEQQAGEVKLGMIKYLNVSEQKFEELLRMAGEKVGLKINKHVPTFYDSLSMMQMGLDSGNVDEISTYKCVADYITARDDKLKIINDHSKMNDSFCFAVRKNDTALKDELDKTIASMKSDGTLDKIVKEYITDVKGTEDPPAVEIEMFEGADTIKVAVTGDLPPLDLVLADGQIAGFNTAMLSEIGKRLNKNIEVVQIDSGSRAAALASGRADVSFWAIVPAGDDIPKDIDTPDDLTLTEPYFTDEIVHLEKK